jgi:hypothetical protein
VIEVSVIAVMNAGTRADDNNYDLLGVDIKRRLRARRIIVNGSGHIDYGNSGR